MSNDGGDSGTGPGRYIRGFVFTAIPIVLLMFLALELIP